MVRCFAALVAVALLAACDAGDQGAGPDAATGPASPDATRADSTAGKRVYDEVCARCHADGLDGAPKTGDPAAWEGRSRLWQAVLFEHAKSGYLGMPAKGGDESLSDDDVARAAEYMLRATFPDIPPD